MIEWYNTQPHKCTRNTQKHVYTHTPAHAHAHTSTCTHQHTHGTRNTRLTYGRFVPYVTEGAKNTHLFCFSLSPASCSFWNTFSRVAKCSSLDDPVIRMSSRYTMTPGPLLFGIWPEPMKFQTVICYNEISLCTTNFFESSSNSNC